MLTQASLGKISTIESGPVCFPVRPSGLLSSRDWTVDWKIFRFKLNNESQIDLGSGPGQRDALQQALGKQSNQNTAVTNIKTLQ